MAKKLHTDETTILWKDRRRRFGLPLSFTRYELSVDRLILKLGFFNTRIEEIMVYRIIDLKVTRSFGQKVFGVGTVTLTSTDKSHPTLPLKSIKQSYEVYQLLGKQVDSQRTERGITTRELLGDFNDDDEL